MFCKKTLGQLGYQLHCMHSCMGKLRVGVNLARKIGQPTSMCDM